MAAAGFTKALVIFGFELLQYAATGKLIGQRAALVDGSGCAPGNIGLSGLHPWPLLHLEDWRAPALVQAPRHRDHARQRYRFFCAKRVR